MCSLGLSALSNGFETRVTAPVASLFADLLADFEGAYGLVEPVQDLGEGPHLHPARPAARDFGSLSARSRQVAGPVLVHIFAFACHGERVLSADFCAGGGWLDNAPPPPRASKAPGIAKKSAERSGRAPRIFSFKKRTQARSTEHRCRVLDVTTFARGLLPT